MLYPQNKIKETLLAQMQLLDEKESEAVLVFIKNLLRKDSPETSRKKAEMIQSLKNIQAQAEKNGLTQEILDKITRSTE